MKTSRFRDVGSGEVDNIAGTVRLFVATTADFFQGWNELGGVYLEAARQREKRVQCQVDLAALEAD